jgi:hypothetical protein
VTQDVEYSGTFPSAFTFHLYDLPPAAALIPSRDGTGHEAYGVLVAYADENGNGELDAIAKGGPAIDKLWGATSSIFDVNSPSYWIQYSDVVPPTPTSWWPAGSQKGFNLVETFIDDQGHLKTVTLPFSTQVPVLLSGENELNALVCKFDYLADTDVALANPLNGCGLPATPGILRVNASFRRSVSETATGTTTSDDTFITLSDDANWVDGATVTINGVLASAHGGGVYESTTRLNALGEINVAVIAAPGRATQTVSLKLPKQESFTSPVAGATFTPGARVAFSWPQGTLNSRIVSLESSDYATRLYMQPFNLYALDVLSATTEPIDYHGEARLNMRVGGEYTSDRFGSYASATVNYRRSLTFAP